jgi:hypothetical protein
MFWRGGISPLDANTGFILGVPVIWITSLPHFSIPCWLPDASRLRLGVVGLGIILMGNLMLFATHRGTKEFLIGMIMAVIGRRCFPSPDRWKACRVGRSGAREVEAVVLRPDPN